MLAFPLVGIVLAHRLPRNPIGWIQAFIDRSFYRTRYHRTKIVEGFSARLRDAVDLDALLEDLGGGVTRTMRPTHALVWLRAGGRQHP
ncbi:MAG: hypothetical protein ACRDJS_09285 [Actinomycetota bacterium]